LLLRHTVPLLDVTGRRKPDAANTLQPKNDFRASATPILQALYENLSACSREPDIVSSRT
jgi:hypothetical protein